MVAFSRHSDSAGIHLAGLLDYTYQPVEVHTDIPMEHRTFKGYRRRNGDVGVRNEIWIIPMCVMCTRI